MWYDKIDIPTSLHQFSHKDGILSMGSCFADEMGARLRDLHFDIVSNPFGILYNPASIGNIFGLLSGRLTWDESSCFYHENKWKATDFHSRVNRNDRDEFVLNIREKIRVGKKQLKTASLIILTLGTAFVWETKEGKIVGNCHKLPARQFNRRMLETDEIKASLKLILQDIRSLNSNALVLYTVSPVRHRRDGMVNNNWSKARLLDACHGMPRCDESSVYFPSYEIMMDELRDYRFYKKDRVHPTEEAVDYIFDQFYKTYFSNVPEELTRQIKKINNNIAHRPFDLNSEGYRIHMEKTNEEIEKLKTNYGVVLKYPKN